MYHVSIPFTANGETFICFLVTKTRKRIVIITAGFVVLRGLDLTRYWQTAKQYSDGTVKQYSWLPWPSKQNVPLLSINWWLIISIHHRDTYFHHKITNINLNVYDKDDVSIMEEVWKEGNRESIQPITHAITSILGLRLDAVILILLNFWMCQNSIQIKYCFCLWKNRMILTHVTFNTLEEA